MQKGQLPTHNSQLSKYGWWGQLPLVQKGQTLAVGYIVCSRYAVRSRYAVCSRCWCKKVNSHSVLSKYRWWRLLPLVQKGQTPCSWGCSMCWCKKVNSHHVLSKYGWWGLLPLVQIGHTPHSEVRSMQ